MHSTPSLEPLRWGSARRLHEDTGTSGAQTSRSKCGGKGQAGFVQNRRVHEDDVGHGDERCGAGKELCPPVRVEALKLEITLEAADHDLSMIALARANTLRSISAVSFPVDVFCWLG